MQQVPGAFEKCGKDRRTISTGGFWQNSPGRVEVHVALLRDWQHSGIAHTGYRTSCREGGILELSLRYFTTLPARYGSAQPGSCRHSQRSNSVSQLHILFFVSFLANRVTLCYTLHNSRDTHCVQVLFTICWMA
jgi:hypothetical protein